MIEAYLSITLNFMENVKPEIFFLSSNYKHVRHLYFYAQLLKDFRRSFILSPIFEQKHVMSYSFPSIPKWMRENINKLRGKIVFTDHGCLINDKRVIEIGMSKIPIKCLYNIDEAIGRGLDFYEIRKEILQETIEKTRSPFWRKLGEQKSSLNNLLTHVSLIGDSKLENTHFLTSNTK